MIAPLTASPVLWYLNRSTGLVVLALLTLTVLLGIAATGVRGRILPGFLGQSLHRNVALLSVTLLVAHVVTAVVDSYVDIRWWQSFVPWYGATYLPLWLGFGTLGLDLIAVVCVTSLLRTRIKHRAWHLLHLSSYLAWAVGVAHGLGIGTDLRSAGPDRAVVWASVVLVGAVAAVRLVRFSTVRTLGSAS